MTRITYAANGVCSICSGSGGRTAYICYSTNWGNSSADTFFDPTPKGALVSQIKIEITGEFTTSSSDFDLLFNLNNNQDVVIPVDVGANQGGLACQATCATWGGESGVFTKGIPSYIYGGINAIGQAQFVSNNGCWYQIDVTLIYTV
jgi:hypothetical protein